MEFKNSLEWTSEYRDAAHFNFLLDIRYKARGKLNFYTFDRWSTVLFKLNSLAIKTYCVGWWLYHVTWIFFVFICKRFRPHKLWDCVGNQNNVRTALSGDGQLGQLCLIHSAHAKRIAKMVHSKFQTVKIKHPCQTIHWQNIHNQYISKTIKPIQSNL